MKIDTHVHTSLQRLDTPGSCPFKPEMEFVSDFKTLQKHLEAQGIEKAILMCSGEEHTFMKSEPEYGKVQECREIVNNSNGFYGWMCNFDPRDPQTIYDRMKKYKENGAVGVGELAINEWMNNEIIEAIFTAAEKLDMPVTAHMSVKPGISYGVCDHPGLPLLEETLQKHPNLKFVGHSQVFWIEISADAPSDDESRLRFGKGPVIRGGRIEELMDKYPNLYADLSAFSAAMAITRDEEYGLYFLEKFQDRLLYATDTVNDLQIFPTGQLLDQSVASGKLSKEAYEKITHLNAERIYNL